jgi:hypothetical protein
VFQEIEMSFKLYLGSIDLATLNILVREFKLIQNGCFSKTKLFADGQHFMQIVYSVLNTRIETTRLTDSCQNNYLVYDGKTRIMD